LPEVTDGAASNGVYSSPKYYDNVITLDNHNSVSKMLSLNGVAIDDGTPNDDDIHHLTSRSEIPASKFHFESISHTPDHDSLNHVDLSANLQTLQRQIGDTDQQKLLANFDSVILSLQ